MRKMTYLVVVATVAAVAVFVIPIYVSFEHNPLPSASKIASIKYRYHRYNNTIEGITPSGQYDEFISLFDDAKRDFNPAKWQVAGVCLIKLKNGNSIEVNLFSTSYGREEAKSAIRIGRKYYRVSTDKKLLNFFQSNRDERSPPSAGASEVTP
jgi:hypothetical protein